MKMETTKRAGVAILIPDKIGFKAKAVTRDKEGFGNVTSEYLSKQNQNAHSERRTNLCVHCSIIYNR